ncbi:hypothetical protein ACDQ55_15285 [Chitinophaga sp. 30R24]|uniref:hypothetical protein n=1 Tax=Chitinophaga sp. 30R24 TaxID=3248838 RepID=UPI003B8F43B1
MRSLNLKRWKSFFTFDLPVNYQYLYSRFRQTHERQRYVYVGWPTIATRRQLINDYWNNALLHYLFLVALSTIVVVLYSGFSSSMYFITHVMLEVIIYLPLYFMVYRPIFTSEFLPKLETVIAEYEGRERAWLEKCKQDQPTNRALVLLFYVLDKTSKIGYLTPSDKCANQLHKIFGVSPKGIKNELDLIFKKGKRAKLEPRHLVEVAKSFEEAYTILEEMQFAEGVQQLKQLEQQFKRP